MKDSFEAVYSQQLDSTSAEVGGLIYLLKSVNGCVYMWDIVVCLLIAVLHWAAADVDLMTTCQLLQLEVSLQGLLPQSQLSYSCMHI